MKRCIRVFLLLSSLLIYAQPATFNFQWGEQTCGLLFDDINLTAQVKGVIQDDIELIFSRVPSNIATFAITNNVHYTGGLDGIDGRLYYPRGFRFGTYKTIGATNYYYVRATVSTNYIAAIDLTNRYASAVQSFSPFLSRLEQINLGNITTNEYVQLFWEMREGRVSTLLDFDGEQGWITEGIAKAKEWFFFRPSILAFSERTVGQHTYLCVASYSVNRTDHSKYQDGACVYAQGAWRFFNPME